MNKMKILDTKYRKKNLYDECMIHLIPFRINLPKKEDYFQIGKDVGGGEFLVVNENNFFSIVKKISGKVVHAHGRGFPFPELSCLFAKKTVYTPYNDTLGQKWWTKFIRRFLFNRCERIIVTSEYGKRNLIKECIKPQKIVFIPLPIDYSFFSKPEGGGKFRRRHGLGNNEPFALCVGIRSLKNPEIMMDACKKAGLKIVMVGDTAKKHTKKGSYTLPPDYVKNDENTILTGWLSQGELLQALDAATIFINSSDYESFGLAIFEAAAAGVPLCLPKYGGFDVFKKCALFHSCRDTNQLAANIRKYLTNKKLREKNAKGAKQIAKNYDYPIVKEMFRKFYNEVLSMKR